MSTYAIREEFLDLVRRDLLGPAGGEHEIVTEENIGQRYLLGMLAPVQQVDEMQEGLFDKLDEDGSDTPEEGTHEIVTEENIGQRYLLGMLAPVQQVDEMQEGLFDKLDEDGSDTPEEGTPEPATPVAKTMFPSSFGISFSL